MKKGNTVAPNVRALKSVIFETSDYSLFKSHDLNRNTRGRKDLRDSMSRFGWSENFPMRVVKSGPRYIIKIGHNRFEIAKELGIPVRFIVMEDDGLLPHEYPPEWRWTPNHIVDSYAAAGFPHYQYLKGFRERYNIPMTAAMGLLNAESVSGDTGNELRAGLFKVTAPRFAEKVGRVISLCFSLRKFGKKYAFINALVKCSKVEGFDVDRFEKKFKAHHPLMSECATIAQFCDEIERIYNYHVKKHEVLPLAIHTQHSSSK